MFLIIFVSRSFFFFRFLKPVQLFFVGVATVVFSCCRPYWTYSNVLLLFSTPPRLSKRLDNQIEEDGRTEDIFLGLIPASQPPSHQKKRKQKRSCGSRYWRVVFFGIELKAILLPHHDLPVFCFPPSSSSSFLCLFEGLVRSCPDEGNDRTT